VAHPITTAKRQAYQKILPPRARLRRFVLKATAHPRSLAQNLRATMPGIAGTRSSDMETVDTLLHGRWVIPVEPDDRVLEDHSVAIRDGRIVAVVPTATAAKRYHASETLHFAEHALIPGLINAHTHAAMTLFRGLADDLPLMEWLNGHIWPAEAAWMSHDFVRDGTALAVAEMLRGGTTCFNDMYFFPDETARVAANSGIRATVGMIMIDFPTVWAKTPDEYLQKGLALHDYYRGNPLVRTAFAPHAPYTVSDQPLEKIRVLAEELDVPIHMHIQETEDEVAQSMTHHNGRPLRRLDKLELLGPRLLAVHMTQLTDHEIGRFRETGGHVVHCPESNLKLASGFCPVHKLLQAGINVALGTDGAASNNDLDMFGEMRTAAMLAKAVAKDASAVPAHVALRMATVNGARALGLDEEIGSLTPGKAADVVAVALAEVDALPVFNPVSHLVYCTSRRQVTDVWIAGKHLLRGRQLISVDEESIRGRAKDWGQRIAAKDKQLAR
jgi:5-methylthioadenosine/S-adenosylhomocysteine deaminase